MEISLGTTAFNDAARCLKRYEYRWVDNLVPKPRDVRPALRRGVWLHRLLQLLDEGRVWELELQRMVDWALDQQVDPEDVETMRVEVLDLVHDYQNYWRGHDDSPGPWTTEGTEVPVQWQPKPGI